MYKTIFILVILLVFSISCKDKNLSYDPSKKQEFIPIERMYYENKQKRLIIEYVLVKNAPLTTDARIEMILGYVKKQIEQMDSIYDDYSVSFFRYSSETANYLTHKYREDWVGEQYVLYTSESTWNDTRFQLGYFFSTKSEKDSTLLDIYVDVSLQEDPIEDYTISNYRRITIMEGITHLKELVYK